MANFRFVEKEEVPMSVIKNDWIKGIRGLELRKKYGISTRKYSKVLDELEADGVKTGHRRKKEQKKPSNIQYNKCSRRFIVKKMINGKYVYGGCFSRKCDAERRVRELESNGWVV